MGAVCVMPGEQGCGGVCCDGSWGTGQGVGVGPVPCLVHGLEHPMVGGGLPGGGGSSAGVVVADLSGDASDFGLGDVVAVCDLSDGASFV